MYHNNILSFSIQSWHSNIVSLLGVYWWYKNSTCQKYLIRQEKSESVSLFFFWIFFLKKQRHFKFVLGVQNYSENICQRCLFHSDTTWSAHRFNSPKGIVYPIKYGVLICKYFLNDSKFICFIWSLRETLG